MSKIIQGCCRLCGTDAVLQDSHLMPKSIYKMMLGSGSSNLNPVVVNPREAKQTSRQVTAHLLCSACEQRFSMNGEAWTLKHCFRDPGKFLIHDFLSSAPYIVPPDGSGRVISAMDVPAIDLDKLVYFAISVFWRASIHKWTIDGQQLKQFSFGETYESEFRHYLLGESNFPNNAALSIFVSDNPISSKAAIFPHGQGIGSYHRYKFAIPGLMFCLYVGKILKNVREICSYCSPNRPIHFGHFADEETDRSSLQLLENAKPTAKLSSESHRRRFGS